MRGFRYVFIAVVASAITVFALQNTGPVSLHFLIWSLPPAPLATVILLFAAAGIVLVGVPLWIDRWRLRARARTLEVRLASAEALLGTDAPPARPPRPAEPPESEPPAGGHS
jgi:uncharacterized integral membrane protein